MAKKPLASVKQQDAKQADKNQNGLIRVKMEKTLFGSPDGISRKEYKEGEEYEIPHHLYKDFESLEAANPVLEKANKSLEDAPLNK